MRKQFTFYKSFDDVYQDLSDKQRLEFIGTMLDVQFLRVAIDDVKFDDLILKHIWNAQKHTIGKSIHGYIDSQKSSKVKKPFYGVYSTPADTLAGCENGSKQKFTFQLKKACYVNELTEEYIEKLSKYIDNGKKEMSLATFLDKCKYSNYKYSNYRKTYDDWNKNSPDVEKLGGYTVV